MSRLLVALGLLAVSLPGQFERYRGPGDVRTQPPRPRAANPRVPSGAMFVDEPNRWSFWWMFHRDRFVPPAMPLLPSERAGLAATAAALHATLAETDDTWLAATCLFALAKLDPQSAATERALLDRLAAPEPRVREAAALGLGLVATSAAAQPLAARLADVTATERDRALAGWALGLASSRAAAATRPSITASLLRAAQEDPSAEVGVAALHALAGTGRDEPTASAVAAELRAALHGASPLRVAHAATALARWLGRGGDRDRSVTATLLAFLGHGDVDVRRAAAVALGRLAIPEDAEVVAALVRATADRDSQTGCFATIALGELGSPVARGALFERFATEWSFTQGWCALGLGLIARAADARGVPDPEIGPALLARLRRTREPELQCALAIALGLSRYTLAATDLRALLAKYQKDAERAGLLAQALALLCDTSAEPLLRKVLADSSRRPELVRQLAPCLGWLGSRDAASQVAQLLLFLTRNRAMGSAVADAVALCRDESTLTNLVRVLRDPTCSGWSHAGAAAALGSIGHAGSRPWSADFAEHVNYRAATATMTDTGGVLVVH